MIGGLLFAFQFFVLSLLKEKAFATGKGRWNTSVSTADRIKALASVSTPLTAPKLRILIICDDDFLKYSHFQLHRRIAECLAGDHENVEKVVSFNFLIASAGICNIFGLF